MKFGLKEASLIFGLVSCKPNETREAENVRVLIDCIFNTGEKKEVIDVLEKGQTEIEGKIFNYEDRRFTDALYELEFHASRNCKEGRNCEEDLMIVNKGEIPLNNPKYVFFQELDGDGLVDYEADFYADYDNDGKDEFSKDITLEGRFLRQDLFNNIVRNGNIDCKRLTQKVPKAID